MVLGFRVVVFGFKGGPFKVLTMRLRLLVLRGSSTLKGYQFEGSGVLVLGLKV